MECQDFKTLTLRRDESEGKGGIQFSGVLEFYTGILTTMNLKYKEACENRRNEMIDGKYTKRGNKLVICSNAK